MILLLLACPSTSVVGDSASGAGAGSTDSGESDTSADTSGDDDTGGDSGGETGDDTGVDPSAWLGDVDLYINLGDSVAAGYHAQDDGGYGWLLDRNLDDDFPDYEGADLNSRSSASVKHITESGATSRDVLGNLQDANLPSASGTVVVTISAGGNDFNDDYTTMISAEAAREAGEKYADNLSDMVSLLRNEYTDVRIYVLNVQDPTDGEGTIPSGYDEGMCELLEKYGDVYGETAVANLGIFNDAIADAALAEGVELLDYHGWFAGHGLNSRDGWMSDDCAHPTSEGHHQLRRLAWSVWTGELYD